MITNNITKKKYVGQSEDLFLRVKDYFKPNLSLNKNSAILRAIEKFGHQNFSYTVLEYCHPENLNLREQHFIDRFKSQYNIITFLKFLKETLNIIKQETMQCEEWKQQLLNLFNSIK